MKKKALRLIDANFNRLKEGLRVCEDILRFVYDDHALTRSFKELRHQASQILLRFPIPYGTLIKLRDSKQDVGKKGVISDKRKPKWSDLFISNAKRAEESLRVLEETSKVVAPDNAREFQALRFKLYELEKRALKKC
ncbi:MAG: thiamine-phosphate pyrophosphorylase [Candidatus Omnitrophica bacterium]|nr:thiamine-phosphate pyrophosphorylase [Candidatus Omnitrophota bacterium]